VRCALPLCAPPQRARVSRSYKSSSLRVPHLSKPEGRPAGARTTGRPRMIFNLVLPNLRRLAGYLLRGSETATLCKTTELVDQPCLTLLAAKDRDWQNRHHDFALAVWSQQPSFAKFYFPHYQQTRPFLTQNRLTIVYRRIGEAQRYRIRKSAFLQKCHKIRPVFSPRLPPRRRTRSL
jgi:hypothetical protein